MGRTCGEGSWHGRVIAEDGGEQTREVVLLLGVGRLGEGQELIHVTRIPATAQGPRQPEDALTEFTPLPPSTAVMPSTLELCAGVKDVLHGP